MTKKSTPPEDAKQLSDEELDQVRGAGTFVGNPAITEIKTSGDVLPEGKVKANESRFAGQASDVSYKV